MERTDIVMQNIKKLELLLQALLGEISFEDHHKTPSLEASALTEQFGVDFYDHDLTRFAHWLENSQALDTNNILLTQKILQGLVVQQAQYKTIFEQKLALVAKHLQKQHGIFSF